MCWICLFSVRTRITEPPQDSRVVKGSKVEIKCGVTHDAAVQVNWVWYHNDGRISVGDERRTTQSDGTLQIVSVRNEDIGNYRCSVHSVAGNDTANADVQVIGEFEIMCYFFLTYISFCELFCDEFFLSLFVREVLRVELKIDILGHAIKSPA